MNYKHALLLSALIFSKNSFSNEVIGKVLKIKGEASALFIGEREAQKVTQSMFIKKDTSILTHDKSIVFILLNDNSKVTIGSNSKMTINLMDDSKVSVLNLQKGNVRTEVVKESNQRNKLILKTRTASLGVRGTDFQTTYNPQNNITNLLTFKGVVAIVKNDQKAKSNEDVVNELKNEKNVKLIEEARFTTVTENNQLPTEPVKISAEQYTKLKISKEVEVSENEIKKEYDQELIKTVALYEKISIEEKEKNILAKRTTVNEKTSKPTSGGLLDLDSGIYIPPVEKKENFNEKLNIFEVKPTLGEVSQTGQYIPPSGVTIDPKVGLIVSSNASSEVKEAVSVVNKEVKQQIQEVVKPSLNDLNIDANDSYKKYYK